MDTGLSKVRASPRLHKPSGAQASFATTNGAERYWFDLAQPNAIIITRSMINQSPSFKNLPAGVEDLALDKDPIER
jgi:hypothetical protein